MTKDYTEPAKKVANPESEKTVTKLVTEEPIQRKPSLSKRVKSVFFTSDFKSTMTYVATALIAPALKNMIADAGKGAIDRAMYGEAQTRRRAPQESNQRVTYNRPVNRSRTDPRDRVYLPDQPPHPPPSSQVDPNDIILINREDADRVLEGMRLIIEQYNVVSLGDLYEMVGLPSQHIDQKWGWSSLSTARVVQIREGYLLELPACHSI